MIARYLDKQFERDKRLILFRLGKRRRKRFFFNLDRVARITTFRSPLKD